MHFYKKNSQCRKVALVTPTKSTMSFLETQFFQFLHKHNENVNNECWSEEVLMLKRDKNVAKIWEYLKEGHVNLFSVSDYSKVKSIPRIIHVKIYMDNSKLIKLKKRSNDKLRIGKWK